MAQILDTAINKLDKLALGTHLIAPLPMVGVGAQAPQAVLNLNIMVNCFQLLNMFVLNEELST